MLKSLSAQQQNKLSGLLKNFMMDKKEFNKKMEELETPEVHPQRHQKQFKMYLINTKKSATFGILFILTPFLFLFGVLFKYYLKIDFGIFTGFQEWLISLEDISLFATFMVRFLLLGGPLIAILINLIAILHFQYDSIAKEISLTIRIKWLNILIIALCTLIMSIFFFYLLVENINHP
ncbi:hypothetical protein QQ008_10800 [Fulvivirgaceae bacterium BMA10]|uniref:Succinate dehydrogenase subunit 4 n=1 Tax=Splendidivirga corallicola TaxID=3051826 RepID=A0ABT8KPA6_9BACT|nr:hypothetical protein [Fulvivirgaceae bacterium BMA10]